MLYRPPGTDKKLRPIIDEAERDRIMWHTHSSPTAGHSGVNATVSKITDRFWWKGVKADVTSFVSIQHTFLSI